MQFEPFDIASLRAMRGYQARRLRKQSHLIPNNPGVYIWRYWPSFPDYSKDAILDTVRRYHQNAPTFIDSVKNTRVSVAVERTFWGGTRDVPFGLSENKWQELESALNEGPEAREAIANALECAFASFAPLYIGKAARLRDRIHAHLHRTDSTLLDQLDDAAISLDDVYVSFMRDKSQTSSSVTHVLEEIFQRTSNPPFTKRYG